MDFQTIWRNFWKIAVTTFLCNDLTIFFYFLFQSYFLSKAKVLYIARLLSIDNIFCENMQF